MYKLLVMEYLVGISREYPGFVGGLLDSRPVTKLNN